MHIYHKTVKQLLSVLGVILLAMLLVTSCTKKDILPEPIGEEVPYTGGTTKTLKEIMNGSSYTFWKAAWTRSDMDKIVAKSGASEQTMFIPTDKAFQAAGWSMDKINAATIEDLDTLLCYHTVSGKYSPEVISAVKGNLIINSLLQNYTLPGYSSTEPYRYKLYVGSNQDSLLIDGKTQAKMTNGENAIDGYVYPVSHLMNKPTMTMLEYLDGDPRFSLYMESIRYTTAILEQDYITAYYLEILAGLVGDYSFTLFAPTNEAFHKSGFNDFDDIKAYTDYSLPLGYADYDENMYYVQPTTAIDSLLIPHGMEGFGLHGGGNTYPLDISYYSNDLLQRSNELSGLLLREGQIYNSAPVIIHLAYSSNNNKPQVKYLKSAGAPLPLAQTDIKLLNGVIHVLDAGLLLPKTH